mmetsp:Transcript_24097/g.67672  ORF Transcript_24097/g.67672 Transcript_24097/m.67672 type:complete len:204 (-) Transcript_24097:417-1028(-)
MRQRLPRRGAHAAGHAAAATAHGHVPLPAPALLGRERHGPRHLRGLEGPPRAHRRRALHQALPGEHVERNAADRAGPAAEPLHVAHRLQLPRQHTVPDPRGGAAHVARRAALPHRADDLHAGRHREAHAAGVPGDALQGPRGADGVLGGPRHAGGRAGCGRVPRLHAQRERGAPLPRGHVQRRAAHAPLVAAPRRGALLVHEA